MGLPQLRWWNNHAWTELTTEARPPLVMQQPTRVLYADDELPTRRQQREQREREEEYVRLATDEGDERDAVAANSPLTTTLREIDPPSAVENDLVTAASVPAVADDVDAGEPVDDAYQPRSATSAVSAPTAQNQRVRGADQEPARQASLPRLGLYTAPVWIIALLPLLQLVIGLLVLLGFGAFPNLGFSIAAFVAPYIVVILLAIGDRAILKRMGHDHTAHWAWAFLSAPVYLIARSAAASRIGSIGLGPLLVWLALGMLQIVSILVVPGMLISVIPTVFANQASQSVASEASTIGITATVVCPSPPPVIVGQQFRCAATTKGGTEFDVTVSLQRANGWIDWHVDNWGFIPDHSLS